MRFEEIYTLCLEIKLKEKRMSDLRIMFNSINDKIRYVPIKDKMALFMVVDMIPTDYKDEYEKAGLKAIKEDFYIYTSYLNLEDIDLVVSSKGLIDVYDVCAETGLFDLIYEYAKDDIERFKQIRDNKNMEMLNLLLVEFTNVINNLTPQDDIIETYNKLIEDPELLRTIENISLSTNPEFLDLQKSISSNAATLKESYSNNSLARSIMKEAELQDNKQK